MNHYNILFYLYLSIVSLLLFVFAVFVSLQLRFPIIYLITFLKILNVSQSISSFSFNDYQRLYCFHSVVSNYVLSISLSEFYLENVLDSSHKKNICASLALLYRDLSFMQIAEYYYLQALSCNPDDIQLRVSLEKMYCQLGYQQDVEILSNDIVE